MQFGDCSLNRLQIIARTRQISYSSMSKWQKCPWRSRSPPFPIPARNIPGCMFLQILWFQLKSVTSYHAENLKEKFTDDRETNGHLLVWTNPQHDATLSLASSSCLYKTQPERTLAQECYTRIDALSLDKFQFHLLLHRNSHHSQATNPKWLNH